MNSWKYLDSHVEELFNQFLLSTSPDKLEQRKIIIWLESRDVESQVICVRDKIENIVWKIPLVKLLLLAKEFGLIEISDNLINQFQQEKEVKIKSVNKEELIDKLSQLWAVKVFDGFIEDVYYDFWDDYFENVKWKVSFRIRKKDWVEWGVKYFYTIKRKMPKNKQKNKSENEIELRNCYEEEFEILEYDLFIKMINNFWYYKSRAKSKNRVSYQFWDIKFDIDDYEWIPTVLEIEASTPEVAFDYIQKLWFENHDTTIVWSRWFFKSYGVSYTKFPKPKDIKIPKVENKTKDSLFKRSLKMIKSFFK